MEVEILGDRYELQEPIGRGGMATIFRANDLRMGRPVAVKILREVYSSDPKFVTRFQREARAASMLQHPNIVQVFDYGQTGESYYIVMEFIDGTDLRHYLKRSGKLTNERAAKIAHDVALGLGAAHKRGIVHRDVKPQNIMLDDDDLVKLTDFGIASVYKDVGAERLTTTGMTLGTVQYYAPEQAQGEVVTPAADIYALGIVLYEMLAGRTPFEGDTPVAVAMHHIQDLPEPPSRYNPNIAPALEKIILRCLEKDPRDRYRDGDALAYALENYDRRPGGRTAVSAGRAGVPVGLPSDGGPQGARGLRPYSPLAFDAPAPQSGPRGAAVNSGPGGPRTPVNSGPGAMRETYDAPGLSTRPYGPAGGTMPRTPGAGRGGGGSNPEWMPRRPEEGGSGGRRTGPIVGMAVVGVVVLLALSCFVVLNVTGGLRALGSAFEGPTPTATLVSVNVPNFKNKTLADAQTLAKSYNLTVTVTSTVQSATVPKGSVVDQNPEPGTYTGINSVSLTLSGGPNQVALPDVTKKQVFDACYALTHAPYFLTCANQGAEASNLPAGEVTRTNPAAGTLVTPGTAAQFGQTIEVWTSEGPPPTATPDPLPTATSTPTPCPTLVPPATPGTC